MSITPLSTDFSRRELLRIGGLSLFATGASTGLSSVLTAANRQSPIEPVAPQRNCIYMMLQGGPSHIDLWDPKPEASEQVRGVFRPIDTNLPGLRFGELMAQTAKIGHHLAVVRSMTHRFNNHIAGTYIMLTGSTDQPNADREARAEDFPGPGAVLNYLQTTPPKVPVSVSLPTWLSIPGPSNRMPGQYAGFLGSSYDPFLIQGEPEKPGFKPLSLTLPDEIAHGRFTQRTDLLAQLDAGTRHLENKATRTRDRLYESAYELLTDPRVKEALDLSREPDASRDRYGRNRIGQSLLLARRLVEAGVRLVGYNEFNQAWDHHGNIEGALKSRVPQMEQAFSTLVQDLEQRGLLGDTLVVNTGEFGRTPVINGNGGRDHWPDAYTTVLAGGGIRGGQIYGSTDDKGAYVATKPVSPDDLLATVWTCLGIDPHTELRDRLNRPLALSKGRVVAELL